MEFENLLSIAKTAKRAKAEGLGITENALRCWVKSGLLPVVYAGSKALIYWPNLLKFLSGDLTVAAPVESPATA